VHNHKLQRLSQRETIAILADSPDIPDDIVARINRSRPCPDRPYGPTLPLVVPEAFNMALDNLIADKGPAGSQHTVFESRWASYDHVVALACSSILMAHMLAGEISIPRPRLLHEHTQSVLNIYSEYMADLFTDPRDSVVPIAHVLKDIGKSFAVAIHPERSNKDQAVHNEWITRRLLADSNLNADQRKVIELHVEEKIVGWALAAYTEKGIPLEDVLQKGRQELQSLFGRCPADYRGRFKFQLAGTTFADMAAHTQKAYFISAADGHIYQDVTDADRYIWGDAANGETEMTLDRLFSEAPEDAGRVRFRGAGRIAVIQGLFPEHYEQFISEVDNV